jgi:acyl transferase domain-containing protein/NAD(P)H-dependent flavin oxidoreductase YrpB (nitropropane dioxygenase family)/NAD(P)-dependent dehydrogenase (short-subunit alcohol dehydrogenase family)
MAAFQIVVMNPSGHVDPTVAIAASRAGGMGVLNLEFARDPRQARDALARMSRFCARDFGLRLDTMSPNLTAMMLADLPESARLVILTGGGRAADPRFVREARDRGCSVWLEVTGAEGALLGESWGVDGLVACGSETGGWVEEETTFILLQRLLARQGLPVWARGGIALHTAAACAAAGASGVVLDIQLALVRESTLPDSVKAAIATCDGSETVCLGSELGSSLRVYSRPRLVVVEELGRLGLDLARDPGPGPLAECRWYEAVASRIGWDARGQRAWPLGQDAALAAGLAVRYGTVAGVLRALTDSVDAHIKAAQALRPLDADSPLARSHGTRYPIVQGPMTRVSDCASFARDVAAGGGLPFLALALSRGPEVDTLLAETKQLLGERPWGVGILGFVPLGLRQEQMEVVRRHRPPFALIAGGRPDQAQALEQDGIATYLHVPSLGLLRMFLGAGARRFVFEGRECGGHVGPRSSFVLWESMIDVLLEHLPAEGAEGYHVLFAGGIHDSLSASMVATLAAPLAERGVRLGVLLGTSYLFTREAVSSGAIQTGFQDEALRCRATVLVESGPGHAIRCVRTPFVDEFEIQKRRLREEGRSAEEVRQSLEELNIGRLRIASKGIIHNPGQGGNSDEPRYLTVGEDEQRASGMFMIGQLAGLRDRVCTISELHADVALGGSNRLGELGQVKAVVTAAAPLPRQPAQVAIIGMSCILPKADDLREYWDNILSRVNAITEIPEDRWDWRDYFDPDPKARDKIYSRWGGFLSAIAFDPLEFGMPPNSLHSIDPMHLLALHAARSALGDAGYLKRPFNRAKVAVILGSSGGTGDLGSRYNLRSGLPLLFGDAAAGVIERAGDALPEWTEDSFAGLLQNVAAGRIANRLDLGGLNFTVDAACASSLAAVHLAVDQLETGGSDMVLVGGVDTVQTPFGYLCFSKTHALSATGQPRPFDAEADGIAISEGVVMLVLKRLADAERDGDRIYAVIRGVGGSSDGKAKGLTAPRPEGQMLALRRAYAQAGFAPTTVDLFEAHGTGTVVGDRTEALALSTFLEEAGALKSGHALGSVKSMIGHTKATAGVAGLAKVALALHQKVLPPTLGVTKPTPRARFGDGPLYINTLARPWIRSAPGRPRRAGVSAFGFGGTNFHAVIEEYTGEFMPDRSFSPRWSSELFLWGAPSRAELQSAIEPVHTALARDARPELHDLAYAVSEQWTAHQESHRAVLAVVATSREDLLGKLNSAQAALTSGGPIHDPRGIYHAGSPLARQGALAVLFPGQGSQYPNMLRDLALSFPAVREVFEAFDERLGDLLSDSLGRCVFPPPTFHTEEEEALERSLARTDVAQPALGASGAALFHLLGELGISPEMAGGHSYGEYLALYAAGVIDFDALAQLSFARGRAIIETVVDELGTMVAVDADAGPVTQAIKAIDEVWVANHNSPEQTILSGTRSGIDRAVECLKRQGWRTRPIATSAAFHSPIMAPAQSRLAVALAATRFAAPRLTVYSNTTAAPFPIDPDAIAALLAEHLVRPVRFVDEVEAMYEAGARLFVEVGPRGVLTGLTGRILGDRPHLAVALDHPGRPGLLQLQHALGQLAAHGVALDLAPLFAGRDVRRLDPSRLVEQTAKRVPPSSTWLVDGSRARPIHQEPAPLRRPPIDAADLAPAGTNGHGASMPRAAHIPGEDGKTPNGQKSMKPMSAVDSSDTPAPSREPRPARPVSRGVPQGEHGDEAAAIMIRYHRLLDRIVESQRDSMLAFLGAPARRPTMASPQAPSPPGDSEAPLAAGESRTTSGFTPTNGAHTQPRALVAESAPIAPDRAATVGRKPSPELVICPEDEPAGTEGAPVPPSREQIVRNLLSIVSDRTGYPTEMLDLDVDLEAQLGIDSIKRVEILGTLQAHYLAGDRRSNDGSMEALTEIKTLGGIVAWIEQALCDAPSAERGGRDAKRHGLAESKSPEAIDTKTTGSPATDDQSELPRLRCVAIEVPIIAQTTLPLAPGRVVAITDDGRGLAEALARLVRYRGGSPVLIRDGSAVREAARGIFEGNLGSPETAASLVELVRQHAGPIGALVHLRPMADGAGLSEATDLSGWRDRIRRDVKSLFYLAKAAAADLQQAAAEGGAVLLAATAMGGDWASGKGAALPFFPAHGGLAGLIKTLALEWPGVRCKAVDLGAHGPADALAAIVGGEMGPSDGRVEVGYQNGRRMAIEWRPAPLEGDRGCPPLLAPGSVVLVTGGARGITAEVACDLARRYQPTLILVGRSPMPDAEESATTCGLSSPQEIKAAMIAALRRSGESPSLPTVEAACRRLLRDREIGTNLARIRQAGAQVRYETLDVCDERAMAALLSGIEREYGRLDAVIHGAGVIEDKLIAAKSADSFDRVFDTKADSALLLSRLLRPESLKFLVFFSSASGAFGNRGQSDYAAANEVLNKLAAALDERWPGRVVAIGWGPWDHTGMVTDELRRQFAARGIEPIAVSAGCRALDRELRLGAKGESSVVVAGGSWGLRPPVHESRRHIPETAAIAFPLLEHGTRFSRSGGAVEALRVLDPSRDCFLQDHRLDGKPVLPMACAMELLAELVQHEWPDLQVIGIRDLHLLKGIVLDGPREIVLSARAAADPPHDRVGIDVDVTIKSAEDGGALHYRATVELADQLPPPLVSAPAALGDLLPFPLQVDEAYRRWLFHGPLFQGIDSIEGITPRGMACTLRPADRERFLLGGVRGPWLMDPVIVDSALQLLVLWSRSQNDMTPLPSRFRRYRRHGSLAVAGLRCFMEARATVGGHMICATLRFVGPDGRELGVLEELEGTSSRELNRLSGGASFAGREGPSPLHSNFGLRGKG